MNQPYPKPQNHRILVQLVAPEDTSILLPDGTSNPNGMVVVRAVASDVTCCVPGDNLVLMPGVSPIGYDKERNLVFIHDSHVVAVEPNL